MASCKDRKPQVPAGWFACWDDRYKGWFYADQVSHTSQWQEPPGTYFPPENDSPAYEKAGNGAEESINGNTSLISVVMPMEMAKFKPPTSSPPTSSVSFLECIGVLICFVTMCISFLLAFFLMFPSITTSVQE